MLRIGLVVGEPSGDELGAGLIKSLQELHDDVHVEGILGPRLSAIGGKQIFSMDSLSVMGLAEVLTHYLDLASIRNRLKHHFLANPPDVFIGIDAPDFNLQLETDLRVAGIRTIHYVSPSVWAWRPSRVKAVTAAADKLLTLFPFESAFYSQCDLEVDCVGHPLADTIPMTPDPSRKRKQLRLPIDKNIIAIMPGSRRMEFARHIRPFIKTALRCWRDDPQLHFVSSLINDDMRDQFRRLLQEYAPELPIDLHVDSARDALEASDVALLASGTITLEAMLLKKPMVIGYCLAPFSYHVLRRLVVSKWVGLPNILARESLVPEFFQHDVHPDKLAPAIRYWLNHTVARDNLKQRFTQMHDDMRRGTNQRAAQAVLSLCRK